MARGSWTALPALALLLAPALAPAAGGSSLEDTLAFADLMARQSSDYVGAIVSRATPASPDTVLLLGYGTVTVKRFGMPSASTCEGDARMVIEGSWKPFRLEPSATITFGGARQQGPLLLPCLLGHTHQPTAQNITGTFDGAWSAAQDWGANGWSIQVGAPDAGGARVASYAFWQTNGGQDTFTGTLLEYR